MANGHGGYRAPSNEKRAAVSNPRSGKRTDGMAGSKQNVQRMQEVPSNGQWGYRKETAAATQGAQLAGARPTGPSPAQMTKTPVVGLFAPDQNPDRPVTFGSSMGPGYTPEPQISDNLAMIKNYKDLLDTAAAQPNQSPAFIQFWNAVKAQARNF